MTGGPSGESSVEVGGKTYEVGDSFEAPAKDLKWLIDDGYITAGAPKKTAAPSKKTTIEETDEEAKDGDE